ncbi:hypothetical protein [Winogradskyella sp. SYSU M77433]|uniref:hypothetical protein n=1 Tax=Winogradskyella sp. SYSU M77433 TaxID=3042722 RepID=UPI0024812F2B|nr:hypothetical protein [Winogradskyella sp. SYSU M77433]MDH7914580.1 hypothetical protein [Winogradskyella sp. SYSU M77433]
MKNLLNLGKTLNKLEQRNINGGANGNGCVDGYYTCSDGTKIYVGDCRLPHIVPCY